MDTITFWEFVALAAATALVGFSKTAVNGANTVSLAVFAAVLPPRASTGVLLPLLITGDVIAVRSYRRHAHWPTLWRLFPAVGAGVALGALFMLWADDTVIRVSIGAILLLMTAITVWRRRMSPGPTADRTADAGADAAPPGPSGPTGPTGSGGGPRTEHAEGSAVATRAGRTAARSYGVLGGFTTMVANAAGPVMSLYLLSAGFRKLGFLGTSAWFYLIVNIAKLPFSVGLGLLDSHALLLDAELALFVVPGALLGRWAAHRINQRLFEQLVIGATIVGGLQLLLR